MTRSPSRSVSPSPKRKTDRKSHSPSRSRSRTPPIRYQRNGVQKSRTISRSRSRTPPVHKRNRKSPSRSRSRSRDSRTPPVRDYHKKPREYRRSRSPHSSRRQHRGMGERTAWPKRDSPDPSRCLGVFNLSMDTTEKDLRKTFEEFGEIEKIDLIYDRSTGQSRGFGFIYFERLGDASDARDKMNGIDLDGRTIRIDYSMTKKAHSPTPGHYQGGMNGGRGGGHGGFGGYGDRGGGRGYGGDRYGDRGRGGYDRGYGGGRSRRSPSPRRRSPSYERDRDERY